MEILLAAIILFLFGFLVYRDLSHRKDMSAKDALVADLTLKFMSKDATDYSNATKPEPKNAVEEIDTMIPIEDMPFEKLDKAVDEL